MPVGAVSVILYDGIVSMNNFSVKSVASRSAVAFVFFALHVMTIDVGVADELDNVMPIALGFMLSVLSCCIVPVSEVVSTVQSNVVPAGNAAPLEVAVRSIEVLALVSA